MIFSALADIDANVNLKSPSIKYKGYNFKNADLSISTKQGKFRTNKLTGVMFGGAVKASIESTLNTRPRMKVIIDFEGIDLEKTTSALTGSPMAGGKMGLRVNLNSLGGNEAELVNNLSGSGSLQLKNVNVQKGKNGTMLAGALGLIASLNQVSNLFGKVEKASGLVDVLGSFTIRNGIAKSNNIRVISDLGNGIAAGAVNLPRWGIDVKGNVKLDQNIMANLVSRSTRKNITQTVPFAIYGKLDSPSIKLDTSKITGGLINIPGADKLLKKLPKGVGGVLKGLLGGRSGQKDTTPNIDKSTQSPNSQQQQKIDPVDIMKEIFRRR